MYNILKYYEQKKKLNSGNCMEMIKLYLEELKKISNFDNSMINSFTCPVLVCHFLSIINDETISRNIKSNSSLLFYFILSYLINLF
jgi:hypothetical protein